MFGIRIVTEKELERIRQAAHLEAHNQAVLEIIEVLRNADKVYLDPVTLVGDGQKIANCVFFGASAGGTAISIEDNSSNVVMWDDILTDKEIEQLAAGADPATIHPDKLWRG